MIDLKTMYEQRVAELERRHQEASRNLRNLALFRLSAFLAAGFFVYLAIQGHWGFWGTTLLFLIGFAWLVARYEDRKYALGKLTVLIELNRTERRVLDHDYRHLDDGQQYRNPEHAFSEDLDLFGPGSFFQYLSRCGLASGADRLASWLTANDCKQIAEKQEAVKELAPDLDWRQDYYATGRLSGKGIRVTPALSWMEGYEPFTPSAARFLPTVFSLVSLGILALFVAGHVSGWVFAAICLTGLLITAAFARRVGKLASDASRVQDIFEPYSRLVAQTEGRQFTAGPLRELRQRLARDGRPVSAVLRTFSRRLSALDQRNNLLVAFLGNALLLWDLRQAHAVEAWISEFAGEVRGWFDSVSELDAWCCLANFAYNNTGFAYPEIHHGSAVIRSTGLAHPLLPARHRVANDFTINREEFHVITGANMAGKSTFLRTISLGLVMANTGLPVCAGKFSYSPMPLISSMRTSDSLARNESYFFAELKRLQFLVRALEDRSYFVVLDEILKGTNSTDKARGSQLFIKRLVNSGATGVIATHDLSLCRVAEELEAVSNWHFDAEIRDGELHFDYELKPGVCTSMNASYLLRKMGLVDE